MDGGRARRVGRYARTGSRRRNASYREASYREKASYRETGYGETLIRQCTVCGVIMICLLAICLIKLPVFEDIRQSLKTALSGDTGMEAITAGIAEVTDGLESVRRSVSVIFGGDDYIPAANVEQARRDTAGMRDDTASTRGDTWVQDIVTPPVQSVQSPVASVDFRIDEDILGAISARQDFYGEAEKKLAVPAQSTPPERSE